MGSKRGHPHYIVLYIEKKKIIIKSGLSLFIHMPYKKTIFMFSKPINYVYEAETKILENTINYLSDSGKKFGSRILISTSDL